MKPINLRDEEVRGLLDGTRRMLVRPVRRQPFKDEDGHWCVAHERGIGRTSIRVDEVDPTTGETLSKSWEGPEKVIRSTQKSPFGSAGDLLWVREAFTIHRDCDAGVVYRADITREDWENSESWMDNPMRSGVAMPRSLSRLTLTTKSVRVVRVQEISDDDIIADGYEWDFGVPARGLFEEDWNKNHGKSYPWDSNPWAWLGEVTAALADGGEKS